jgi:hypothetical protein
MTTLSTPAWAAPPKSGHKTLGHDSRVMHPAPSPGAGEGWDGGKVQVACGQTRHPHPGPPPSQGEGSRCANLTWFDLELWQEHPQQCGDRIDRGQRSGASGCTRRPLPRWRRSVRRSSRGGDCGSVGRRGHGSSNAEGSRAQTDAPGHRTCPPPRVPQARPASRQQPATLALRRLTCVEEAGIPLARTRRLAEKAAELEGPTFQAWGKSCTTAHETRRVFPHLGPLPAGEGEYDFCYDPPFLAFGKNSGCPSTRKSAIAFWPWSESSQSMNACPSLAFTWACLAGLTRMTPY